MPHGPAPGLLVPAGLIGAAGVGLAAAASHVAGGAGLTTAAVLLVLHAAALTGLAALGGRGAATAGLVLAAGSTLFAADLSLRAFAGHALFAYAAPTGGFLMIGGWLAVAGLGLARWRGQP
ncbi:DUF423 domain-containing protein [Prosthecomicrobium sp. N25]|uniref:DUF423 domain-containing protein n=1 Tax=Prosthecomicrobium sp. N25 TaxID=3129254 RepID=UPI003076AAD6